MGLVIEHLYVRFGGLVALNDFSVSIEDGEIVALIGPNGAGKSTFINAVTGFVKSEGSILLNGKNIAGLPPYKVNREGIVRTFQLVKIFPKLTVLENIMVGAHSFAHSTKESRHQAQEILDLVYLSELKDVRASELTLARQKHLELARSLATRPKLLFLDELVTGLTADEVKEMADILKHIRQELNITILFIEHIMDAVVALAERVIVLNSGCKLTEGSVQNVMNDPAVIEAYLGGDIE